MTPGFEIPGSPGQIRARAAVTRSKGQSFVEVGAALARVTTDGWTGRAAEHFSDKFSVEPERWHRSGDGFLTAAGALEGYADALEAAQRSAADAQAEYARGEQVTRDARAAYDADVARARHEAAQLQAQGTQVTLTIEPFTDPGQPVRDGAVLAFGQATSTLEAAAHECAAGVRAGCAAAPHKRNWLESGLAFVGGILQGAGESARDLEKLGLRLQYGPVADLVQVATGHLTLEELAAKNRLTLTQAASVGTALQHDPAGFGENMGKAVLDWDTWSDDPARAIGHLVPDAVITLASGGAGAGVKVAEGAATVARGGTMAAGAAGVLRRGAWDALKDVKAVYATTPDGLRVPAGFDTAALRDLILEARAIRPEDLPPGLRKTRELLGRMPTNGLQYHEGGLVDLPQYLKAKYPDGVRFTPEGFPNFRPYAREIVTPDQWGPTRPADARRANKLAGLPKTPKGWTWHHAEDGTMQLIPSDLHREVRHSGGVAINKANGVPYRD